MDAVTGSASAHHRQIDVVHDVDGTLARRALRQLAVRSVEDRMSWSVVPAGIPLIQHRSLVDNVALLCLPYGVACGRMTIIDALRRTEIPDLWHENRSRHALPSLRLRVWMALWRLAPVKHVLVVDPFQGVPQHEAVAIARLLRDAFLDLDSMVVATIDPAVDDLLTDAPGRVR